MERHIRRVQRWLDRCLEACRIGQWHAALAEMECAKADMEAARQHLWETLQGAEAPVSRWRRWDPVWRGVLGGISVVLALAHPVAYDDPVAVARRESPEILAFVTQDEQTLLTALRSSLGAGALRRSASGADVQMPEVSRSEASRERKRPRPELPVRQGSSAVAESPASQGREGAVLPTEDILALVQVGERALRDTAVRVVGD